MNPIGFGIKNTVTFLQEDNVRNNSRSGIILKRGIGQTNSTDKVGSLREIPSNGRTFLIKSTATRYESNHTTRANLVQGLGKEIVVNKEVVLIILLIHDLEMTEWHVADCYIKEAIGKMCLFVSANRYSVFLIELSCNSARKTIKLYSVDLTILHTLGEHTHKVARTARRFKQISALESHLFKSIVHCSDNYGRSIKCRQR